jgi:hypothetical protein
MGRGVDEQDDWMMVEMRGGGVEDARKGERERVERWRSSGR